MTANPQRLQRLARAQSDLGQLLEAKIAASQQRGTELASIRAATLAALEGLSRKGLTFYAAALQRLSELDRAAAENEAATRNLIARLLQARTRQDALQRRADAQAAALARKTMMEETRETVLAMHNKATGKGGVMK